MINFNGNTKKRNVNLGEKRNSVKGVNFLEKSKLQRKRREEQRIKDKASLIIQKYVIRYLAEKKYCEGIYDQWFHTNINSQIQFDIWVTELQQMVRFVFPSINDDEMNDFLKRLSLHISRWQVTFITNKILIKALFKLLELKKYNESIINKSLVLINETIDKSAFETTYPNLIGALSNISNQPLVPDIIIKVNMKDSVDSFLKYLVSYPIYTRDLLPILRQVFTVTEESSVINEFSGMEKVQLLLMYLSIHNDEKFTLADILSIGNILNTIFFSVVERDEEDDESDEESPSQDIIVPLELREPLKKLYNTVFIDDVMDLFTRENDSHSHVAMGIISSLFHILPEYKTRICITITISPGSYKWFFRQLKNDAIYTSFKQFYYEKIDYLNSTQIQELYETLSEVQISKFWKILITFEEVYSYWLIVSNDLDSFSHDKLDKEEVIDFLQFLRVLCLTLLFNSESSTELFGEYEKLKSISVTLLNQLYLRNLRLPFLPNDFWTTRISVSVTNITKVLAEQQDIEENNDLFNKKENYEVDANYKIIPEISFKLEVLNKVPFFINFNNRVEIFHSLVNDDRHANTDNYWEFGYYQHHAEIRRNHLLCDAFESFGKAGRRFKERIHVTFLNEWNQPEAGIDGGGLTKELLTSLVAEAFLPKGKYRLFQETSGHQVYPNEKIFIKTVNEIDLEQQKLDLEYLRFLGAVIGKCLYEGILIDVTFAPFFLNKWCTSRSVVKNSINDLRSLDEELFSNLFKLTKMSQQELDALEMDFTINEKIGRQRFLFDLMGRGGSEIPVTISNRLNYIHQLANFKLNTCLNMQTRYFLDGMHDLISSKWLKMFSFQELQMLISGSEHQINLEDWKLHVAYSDYSESSPTILYFWETVENMTSEEKSKLLKFVTSATRPPLLGFKALDPPFGIRCVASSDRLPTASTCFNLLKLPDYRDKDTVRDKLLYAINTGAGFDLS